MALTTSSTYKQHNYMGEYADDATALTAIRDQNWDSNSNGTGNPRNGMWYYNTTSNVFRAYTSGAWGNLGGGGSPGGADTQLQYNNSGAFGGDADLAWDDTNHFLQLGTPALLMTGGHTTQDTYVSDGAIIVNTASVGSSYRSMRFRCDSVINNSSLANIPDEVYCDIYPHATNGGMNIWGFSNDAATSHGLRLHGHSQVEDTTTTTSSNGVVELYGSRGSLSTISDSGNILSIDSGGTKFLMKGDGAVRGLGSWTIGYGTTYDDNPGTNADGLTLHQGIVDAFTYDDPILVMRGNGVSTGLTAATYRNTTETYARILQANKRNGGAQLDGFAETSAGLVGIRLRAISGLASSDPSAAAPLDLQCMENSGATSGTAIAVGENLVRFSGFSNATYYAFQHRKAWWPSVKLITGDIGLTSTYDTVSDRGISIYTNGLDNSFETFAPNVATGVTEIDGSASRAIDTRTTYCLQQHSSSAGGTRVIGLSDQTYGLSLEGIGRSASSTISTASEGPISLRGHKWDSVDTNTSLAGTEVCFTIRNYTTTRAVMTGNGDWFFSGKISIDESGSFETAPDVDSGGLCLNHGANDGNVLTFKNSDVSVPYTSVVEADTYMEAHKRSGDYGGAIFRGYADSGTEPGMTIHGFSVTPSTSVTSTTAQGCTVLRSSMSDGGTGIQDVDDNRLMVTIRNRDTNKIQIVGDGSMYFVDTDAVISTGNEDSPDCSGGGICLNQNAEDTDILTFKSSDVAHGMTNIAETDTYGTFAKGSPAAGALRLTGLADSALAIGIALRGYGGTTDNTTGSAAIGAITLEGAYANGTGVQAVGNTDNVFVVRNRNSSELMLKGNGDLYTQTGTGGPYDDENDLALAEAAKYEMAGCYDRITKKDQERLHELGIMKNGYVCHQKMMALQLGAFGQIWNVLKGLAEKLGFTDEELLALTKNYS